MKTYIFEEACQIVTDGTAISPTKPKLWEKTNNLFEFCDQAEMVKYYENLGGRWKLVAERKMQPTPKQVIQKQPIKNEDIGPIFGITEDDYDFIRDLKEYDPQCYRRMRNWD